MSNYISRKFSNGNPKRLLSNYQSRPKTKTGLEFTGKTNRLIRKHGLSNFKVVILSHPAQDYPTERFKHGILYRVNTLKNSIIAIKYKSSGAKHRQINSKIKSFTNSKRKNSFSGNKRIFLFRQGLPVNKLQRDSNYFLANWFGVDATQNESFIYIKKADFSGLGLVSSNNNSINEILFSLVQLWVNAPKNGRFSVDFYRFIEFLEEGQNYAKAAYLLKSASRYNSSLGFPSPDEFLR